MAGWDGWLPPRETVRHRAFVENLTTVQERRAPTDESVRLLREMEKAAESKFTDSLRLEGNNFNAVVALNKSLIAGEMIASCVFDFNGVTVEVEATASRREMIEDRYAVVHKLRAKVSEMVVGEILAHAFLPLVREFD